MSEDSTIDTWRKRIRAAEGLKENWERRRRVQECYDYWNGDQLKSPFDEQKERRAQVNKVHAEVRQNIPSMYFYRPFAKLTAEPELSDTPGSRIEEQTQLLQDTVNHFIRLPEVGFRENTYLPLLESHWAFGCVEVGYSANFVDAPNAPKPDLKEDEKTKVKKPTVDTKQPIEEIKREISDLKGRLREKFYVRHIPARQVLISFSDKPCLNENDWVGYWEDLNVEDVKKVKAWKNTKDIKAQMPGDDKRQTEYIEIQQKVGEPQKVRVYRIWNLRTMQKLVLAEGHDKYLFEGRYKRCPLKFLRFDIDPYHFLPRPPLLDKLGPQDEYNRSREFIRQEQKNRVARFTYDEDLIAASDMKKLERGIPGVYTKQKGGGNGSAIYPVQQPSYSGEAIQALTLSDKEFKEVGGIGGDARVSQQATATQAKIAAVKDQVQDSYDRGIVADWLAEIAAELLHLAIENMNVEQFISVNIAPDTIMMPQLALEVAQDWQAINADKLQEESQGIRWSVDIDIESMSPVSEEEAFQKWMQGLAFIGNPAYAMLFAASPEMFEMTLQKMGVRSGKDKMVLTKGLQAYAQLQMNMMQQAQKPSPGVSPMGGSSNPGAPAPAPGGPQPGGPAGPGASTPS